MKTKLSLLRGINVSGQKKVPMNELKSLYEELGFKAVLTYIQSGNVIFNINNDNEDDIAENIEKAIVGRFGFQVPVLIRNEEEMKSIINSNPFMKEKEIDETKLYVTFLENIPSKDNIEKTESYHYEPDRFYVSGKEVYVYCPGGYGRTKLNNNFFENKLKVKATTRNWRSVNELLKIMQDISS